MISAAPSPDVCKKSFFVAATDTLSADCVWCRIIKAATHDLSAIARNDDIGGSTDIVLINHRACAH
jgi:hypothetical protein